MVGVESTVVGLQQRKKRNIASLGVFGMVGEIGTYRGEGVVLGGGRTRG